MHLDDRLWRGGLQCRRAARLRSRMEVVGDPTRREEERVVLVGLLGWRRPLGALDEGLALRVHRGVLIGLERSAGDDVVPVRLAHLLRGVEDAVLVLPLLAVRVRVIAWPLDGAELAQLRVAHAGVVARSALRAGLPALERPFRVAPLHERPAVL